MVLQLQFTLFQTAQLKLVMSCIFGKCIDDCVKIAMLDLQLDNAAADVFSRGQAHFVAFNTKKNVN